MNYWIRFPACRLALPLFLVAAILGGCAGPVPEQPSDAPSASPYLLAAEPPGARSVADVRKSARSDETVVVVGRIGGDVNPWIDGSAAFLLADLSLVPCNQRPGDACPTPWDYCCDVDRLKDLKLMVQLVDGQDHLLPTDARKLLGVKELQTVVVRGRAKRDEAGNVILLADGLHVRSAKP